MKKTSVLVFFILISLFASAQWRIGTYGGIDLCFRSRYSTVRLSDTHTAKVGGTVGIDCQYNIKEWLGIRSDINVQFRNYDSKDTIFDYKNCYLNLPIMANLSIGGDRLRAYINIGGYIGYWTSQRVSNRYDCSHTERRGFSDNDQRFDAGVSGGLGISFACSEAIILNLESMAYYGLVNNKTKESKQDSYDTVPCISLGISYYFGGL